MLAVLALAQLAGVPSPATAAAVAGSGSPVYANAHNYGPLSVSEDGRFVLFLSAADNLVAGDTNGYPDLYLLDSADGSFSRIDTHSSAEAPVYGDAAVSDDGRYVLFASRYDPGSATLLAAAQVYRLDRDTGSVLRLSSDALGQPGNANSYAHDLSADGRYAVFSTDAGNLVGAAAGYGQVYRHDAVTGLRELVSGDSTGQPTAGHSAHAEITPDGRHVLFVSSALQLPAGTFAGTFVRDMVAGVTTLASAANDGSAALQGYVYAPATISCSNRRISADGRFVVFDTITPMAPGDTNGELDVYVRDRVAGTTRWVSDAVGGTAPLEWNRCGSLSADGQTVAYLSFFFASDSRLYVRSLADNTLTQAASSGWGEAETLGSASLSGDGSALFHTQAVPLFPFPQLVRWRQSDGQAVLTQVPPSTVQIFADSFGPAQ
ncbi:TolB family protein [Tahibacter harae]|uniref:TolB family protein n=1 Tax=Tahibacter harae TaxID=2963937 RepID=UPI00210DB33B|nr:hypothetical protein [Tahibacter harae]